MKRVPFGYETPPPPKLLRQQRQLADSLQHPQQPVPNIQDLPDEMLEKLFSYLSIDDLALHVWPVCERWQTLVQTRCINKKLAFNNALVPTDTVVAMLRAASDLHTLQLQGRNTDVPEILDAAATHCKMLQCLAVYSDATKLPIAILRRLSQLTDLTFHAERSRQGLQLCRKLGAALPNLRKLDFNTNEWFQSEHLDAVLDSCRQLEELRASDCCPIVEDIEKLSRCLRHSLRILELNAEDLYASGFLQLGGCFQLRELILDQAWDLTGEGLQQLATLAHLEVLILQSTKRLTMAEWCEFFSQSLSARSLRELCLRDCPTVDDSVLSVVSAACPCLKMLNLSRCDRITVNGVTAALSGCKLLNYLTFSYTGLIVVRGLVEIAAQDPNTSMQRKIHLIFEADEQDAELVITELKDILPDENFLIQRCLHRTCH